MINPTVAWLRREVSSKIKQDFTTHDESELESCCMMYSSEATGSITLNSSKLFSSYNIPEASTLYVSLRSRNVTVEGNRNSALGRTAAAG